MVGFLFACRGVINSATPRTSSLWPIGYGELFISYILISFQHESDFVEFLLQQTQDLLWSPNITRLLRISQVGCIMTLQCDGMCGYVRPLGA